MIRTGHVRAETLVEQTGFLDFAIVSPQSISEKYFKPLVKPAGDQHEGLINRDDFIHECENLNRARNLAIWYLEDPNQGFFSRTADMISTRVGYWFK